MTKRPDVDTWEMLSLSRDGRLRFAEAQLQPPRPPGSSSLSYDALDKLSPTRWGFGNIRTSDTQDGGGPSQGGSPGASFRGAAGWRRG